MASIRKFRMHIVVNSAFRRTARRSTTAVKGTVLGHDWFLHSNRVHACFKQADPAVCAVPEASSVASDLPSQIGDLVTLPSLLTNHRSD
jgi:hypothetical protein